ncbi:lysostaphin resistance A-like protein [Myxococcota bacterium]
MSPPSARIAGLSLAFVPALYVSWTAAWFLANALTAQGGWLATSAGRTGYWTAMKVLLWVLPSMCLIRYSGRPLRDVVFGGSIWSAVLWGIGAGLLLGLDALARKCLARQVLSIGLSWGFLNATVIAPIVEELTFRGAVLGGLMARYRFALANTAAAFFFLCSHLPGWYFQGSLYHNMTQPFGGAVSVFILGWLFGYVVVKSGSVAGGVIAHSLNNFFSQL